ncbi:MAG TPA: hypothetical protein VK364_10855 [Hymenobacter sp.]|jgi:Spy/CpxP family protein refolding chaperone|nr:hypothetical protein [Hymenobacter sp.]HLL94454.1 hypothetical protein [Spirosoma sp.]
MFKKIALSGLLLSFLSLPLLAQQTAAPDTSAQSGARMGRSRSIVQRELGDPATQAKNMTDHMTQQLALDQATSQKVYDIMLVRAQKVDAIHASSDAKRVKKQALKATADDFKAELKNILTPEQFAKLGSLKDRKRQDRGGTGSDDKNQQ